MVAMLKRNARQGLAVLGLCGMLAGTGMLWAQAAPPPPPQQQGGQAPGQGLGGRPGPERMQERQLQMLTRELQLTPEQVNQVKGIQADTMQKMTALRNEDTAEQQGRREKMMAIRQASQDEIRGVLTEEQKTKFDAMQARMQEKRAHQENGHGGPPSPPPAPPQN